jgi:hypothetical protein
MSAVPVFIPPVSIPPVAMPYVAIPPAPVSIPQARGNVGPTPSSARPATAPIRWQLTDRGIAVVLLLVAAILTAAVIAVGVTALRVTSADYDARLHESLEAQR